MSVSKNGKFLNLSATNNIVGPTITSINTNINLRSLITDVVYKDPTVVNVKKSSASSEEFTSISSALASITDSSIVKPYIINIGPGIYLEPELTLSPYISLRGATIATTTVKPLGDHNVINITGMCELSFLTIEGAPLGYVGVSSIDCGDYCQLHKITMIDCDTNILHRAETIDSQMYLEYVDFGGIYSYGIKTVSILNFKAYINMENFYQYPVSPPLAHIDANGNNYQIEMRVGKLECIAGETAIHSNGIGQINIFSFGISGAGVALSVENGADVHLNNLMFETCAKAIYNPSNGDPVNIQMNGCDFHDCQIDVQIDNLDTIGKSYYPLSHSKTFINSITPFDIGKPKNSINVSQNGDYKTIEEAVASINKTLIITTISGSPNITSVGLFRPNMTYHVIVGANIPSNTTITYVDSNNAVLSANATSSDTINATVFIASETNQYSIDINAGIFAENQINVPNYTQIKGVSNGSTIIIPKTNTQDYIFKMGSGTQLSNMTVSGFSSNSQVIKTNTPLITCTKANDTANAFVIFDKLQVVGSDVGFDFNSVDGAINKIYMLMTGIQNCKTSVNIDGSVNPINVVASSIFTTATDIAPKSGFSVKGSNAKLSLETCDMSTTIMGESGIEISNGASLVSHSTNLTNWGTALLNPVGSSGCLINVFSPGFIDCMKFIQVENPDTNGTFFGDWSNDKVSINPQSSFNMTSVNKNVINVAALGGDFTNIASAIASINPIISCSTTNLSNVITSAGLFTADLDGVLVSGSGIAIANTTATFIDKNTMTISNAATATTYPTTNLTFTRATSVNHFTIIVNAGYYTEPAFTIPNYVNIIGSGGENTFITPAIGFSGAEPLINMDKSTNISNIHFQNSSNVCILYNSQTSGSYSGSINRCNFTNCDTCISVCAKNAIESEVDISQCNFYGNFTNAVYINGTTLVSNEDVMVFCNLLYFDATQTNCRCLKVEGPTARLIAHGFTVDGKSTNHTSIEVLDGAQALFENVFITDNTGTAISIPNIGAAPSISIMAAIITNCAVDVNIQHTGTTGLIHSAISYAKTTILSSNINVTYDDTNNMGTIMTGGIYLGQTHSDVTNYSPLISMTTPVGLITGGAIDNSSGGLLVNVAGGSGYLESSGVQKYITFTSNTVIVPASQTNYIYVNNSGTISFSQSYPNTYQNILLGRVISSASSIQLIDNMPNSTYRISSRLNEYLTSVFGAMFISGCITTVNSSLEISISSGKYVYGTNTYTPIGSVAPASIGVYYHSSSNWTTSVSSVIDHLQYDNGTNLIALGSGKFTKHSLYLLGDSNTYGGEKYLLVYGQMEYDTLNDANAGSISIPPTYFIEGIVPIATIVVSQADSTFSLVKSIRPFPISSSSNQTTATSHGSLTGLLNDDHPQYLLTNGSRVITGNLDMGSHNITNATLVNGIDITTHSSRHLPNGADALSTAAPLTVTATTLSNQTGTANSFARSDHSHQLDVSSIAINNLNASTPLTISKGGTGASTFATNFLTGNGINAIQATKVIPTGVVIGDTDMQTLTNKTINNVNNLVVANAYRRGNMLTVDPIYGNDLFGAIGGLPFATIGAALSAASSGQTILVQNGTYNETITVPLGVNIIGSPNAIIQQLGLSTNIPIITLMGDNTIQNIVIIGTSSTTGITMTGISYSSTSATGSSNIVGVSITLTNTTNANATIYGLRTSGTIGMNLTNSTITCSAVSAVSGTVASVYANGSNVNVITVKSGIFKCTTLNGGASQAGVIVNNVNSTCNVDSCLINSTTPYQKLAGTLNIWNISDYQTGSSYASSSSSNQIKVGMNNIGILNFPITSNRIITIPDLTDTLAVLSGAQILSNKTILNNSWWADSTDNTKKLALTLNGLTTGTIRNWTIQNTDDTFVGRNTTDTLTNKSLSNLNVSHVDSTDITKKISYSSSGATTGTTTTLAFSQTANRTISFPNVTDTLVGLTASQTLGNKTILNNSWWVDSTDSTKKLALTLSGLTTGTIRNWTIQNTDDTFVGRNTTDTLTNKRWSGDVNGNTFLGTNSFTSAVGSNNTIFGYGAMSNYNSLGNGKNIAIGYNSLSGLTTGTSNIAIGGDSTASILTTGTNNIILATDNLTTTTNVNTTNTINIGSSIASSSNEIVIGDSAQTIMYNAGSGTCNIGSQTNKYGAVHHTAAVLYGPNASNAVTLSVPSIATAYSLNLPATTPTEGDLLVKSSGNDMKWANGYFEIASAILGTAATTLSASWTAPAIPYFRFRVYVYIPATSPTVAVLRHNAITTTYISSYSLNGANVTTGLSLGAYTKTAGTNVCFGEFEVGNYTTSLTPKIYSGRYAVLNTTMATLESVAYHATTTDITSFNLAGFTTTAGGTPSNLPIGTYIKILACSA